jgi:hypothetical protein
MGAGNGARTRDLNFGKVVFAGRGISCFRLLFCLVNFAANRSRADAFVDAILREMTESKPHLEPRGSLLAGRPTDAWVSRWQVNCLASDKAVRATEWVRSDAGASFGDTLG